MLSGNYQTDSFLNGRDDKKRPFPKDYEKDLSFNLNSEQFHFTILLANGLF
jgi:hypothetical protein